MAFTATSFLAFPVASRIECASCTWEEMGHFSPYQRLFKLEHELLRCGGDKQDADRARTAGVLLPLGGDNGQHDLRGSSREICACGSRCWRHALRLRAVCPLLAVPWKVRRWPQGPLGCCRPPQAGHGLWSARPARLAVFAQRRVLDRTVHFSAPAWPLGSRSLATGMGYVGTRWPGGAGATCCPLVRGACVDGLSTSQATCAWAPGLGAGGLSVWSLSGCSGRTLAFPNTASLQ